MVKLKADEQPLFLSATVIVAALGYFVDIYDLVLFGIVRVQSLKDLGVSGEALMHVGAQLLNAQMFGMLLGGVLWGVLGDKRGRLSVLFGSILLYSVANLVNAFVMDTLTYGILRFVAGIGLAGELGAAITLVSETIDKERRGLSTAFIAGVGVAGAILAGSLAAILSWRTTYFIGGVLGLILLVTRFKMFESGMFESVRTSAVPRGQFWLLFTSRQRFFRYLACIAVGLPLWFIVGILMTFSPEIARDLGVVGDVSAGSAIMAFYGGLVIGDFGSGFVSQWFRSRKKVIYWAIGGCTVMLFVMLNLREVAPATFYGASLVYGIFAGYWAIFVTVAAEQFGTNLRATVSITVPNFVRGTVPLFTTAFLSLKPVVGLTYAASIVGLVTMAIAAAAAVGMSETFAKSLDFLEID